MEDNHPSTINNIMVHSPDNVSALSQPSTLSSSVRPASDDNDNNATTTPSISETIENSTAMPSGSNATSSTIHLNGSEGHNMIEEAAEALAHIETNLPNSPEAVSVIRCTDTQFEAFMDAGYGSDGDVGPAPYPYQEDEQFVEETPLDDIAPVDFQERDETLAANDVSASIFVDIPDDILTRMSILDLKSELKKRGVKGFSTKPKTVLLQLLRDALERRDPVLGNNHNREVIVPRNRDLAGLPTTAFWQTLNAAPVPVPEPNNIALFCAPTIPEKDAEVVPIKYNFEEVFDRPPFVGLVSRPKLTAR
jgi:hypothetical protein